MQHKRYLVQEGLSSTSNHGLTIFLNWCLICCTEVKLAGCSLQVLCHPLYSKPSLAGHLMYGQF